MDRYDDFFAGILLGSEPYINNAQVPEQCPDELLKRFSDISNLLAIPIFHGFDTVGLLCLANRVGGFNEKIVDELLPFVSLCSHFIHATHIAKARDAAEADLAEKESRLRSQFDNANDSVISFDYFGIIESVNPACEKLSGYAAKDLVGRHIAFLLPKCFDTPQSDSEDRSAATLGLRTCYLQNRHSQLIPVEISTNQIDVPNDIIYCSIIRDLSERQKVDRMKNEFVATVSHELRTPLTSIQGALKLVNSGILHNNPDKQNSLLTIAQNNADRLLLLVNDLLDMEKIETGKLELFCEDLDLIHVLTQSVQQMESYAQRFEVTCKGVDWPQHARVIADINRLSQIIANLLSNAIKFTTKNSTIEVSVEDRSDYFRVSVRDYGPGIAAEFKERLFEKFTQADGSSSRRKDGSGLGLSISRRLIELMGGQIGYYNAQPGSVFYIDIPKQQTNLQKTG